MANELQAVMPKILAQALDTLRETAVITQLVNTSYSPTAAQKGDEIDIPLPAKMEAQDVLVDTDRQQLRRFVVRAFRPPG